MVSLYTHKDANIRKTWLLLTLFVGIVIGVGFIFSQVYQDPGILYVAVLLSILSSFGSYWFSDTIVLSLTGARKVEMADAPELYRIVENLAITAGLPMPRVYIIPEAAPNAFATGRNPEHAVVAVTEGLLARLDRSELEGVLAHELSHVGNRDMLLSTVAAVLVGFIAIASDFFLRSSFWGRRRDDREGGNVFAIAMNPKALRQPLREAYPGFLHGKAHGLKHPQAHCDQAGRVTLRSLRRRRARDSVRLQKHSALLRE
jgi:heat shock protein HtpX